MLLHRSLQNGQRLPLQITQLAEQRWQQILMTGGVLQLFAQRLERLAHLARRLQTLQLLDQGSQCSRRLAGTLLTALLGIQHGLFQTRDEAAQGGVHIVAAKDFAHFLHALIDRLVRALGGQAAAHQATTQQIQAQLPTAIELFLLLQAAQVFVFPALCVIAHTAYSGDGVFSIGICAAFCIFGRRISTATGRWSEIG